MEKKNPPNYAVGDRIQVSISNKICDATITAIVETTDGLRLTVSFGHDQVAVIYEWQVVKG